MTVTSRRFELLRRVGAGGYGEVYEARDKERGGLVALKTLPRLEPEALHRFKHEFRALADVSHPALLPLYELHEEDGAWFFTMELVDGVDFLEWTTSSAAPVAASETRVRANEHDTTLAVGSEPTIVSAPFADATTAPRAPRTVDVGRLEDALRQLVGGVAALHARGLVHLDLKPSNVLVDRTGRVRILDFGLVRARAQADKKVAGTPAYMSPEQAAGRPTDAASDWYAVGVMLFEALTGRLPFEGPLLRVIVDKQRLDAPAPSSIVPGVDPALDRLCSSLLARLPADRPSEAALSDLLGRSRALSVPPLSLSPPAASRVLVGREEQMASLRSAFEAARNRAVLVRVRGESGAGKSHLVGAFLDELRGSARVFSTRCFERERVPYGALDGLIDAIATHLSDVPEESLPGLLGPDFGALRALFGVLGSFGTPLSEPLEPHEARRAAARALGHLLTSMQPGPVVLYVDDAQWGDADSVSYFVELFRMEALLVIVTERVDTTGPFLSGLSSEGILQRAEVLEVGRLSHDDIVELVSRLTGSSDEERARAERIADDSGGNALLVSELAVRTNVRAGASLEELIRDRVLELSPSASALLEVIAIAGAPIAVPIAEAAAASGGESVGAIRALTTLRLARISGDRDARRLAPYHDRIREVSVGRMSPEGRRARHLALAQAHEASAEPSPEELSLHLHGAGEHARALPYTVAAARRAAAALAFDRAAALYAEVVAHTSADDPARPARLTELGDALRTAGRGAEAADAYLSAAPALATAEAIELRRRAVEQLLRCGYVERGRTEMLELLAQLGMPARENRVLALLSVYVNHYRSRWRGHRFVERSARELDPMALLRIDTCWAVGSGMVLIDPLVGLEFFQRGVAAAFELGEPTRIARALAHEATFEVRIGPSGLAAAREDLRIAESLLDRTDDAMLRAIVASCGGIVAYLCGHFRQAVEDCDRATSLAGRSLGNGWERETLLRTTAKSLYFMGALDRLAAIVEPAVQLATARRDLYAEVSLKSRVVYVVRLTRDEAAGVNESLDEALARWPGRGLYLQSFFELVARAEVDLYLGEGARALARVESAWPLLRRIQLLRGHATRSEALHLRGRAALAAGRTSEARRIARSLADPAAPWADGLAALISGLASPRADDAVEELGRAARILEAADMELHAAAARWRRGELLGGSDEARAITDARAAFSRRGVANPERMLQMFAPRPEG